MKFGPIYVDHIGIATHNLEEASKFWRLLGLIEGKEDEIVQEQGVKTRFFSTSKGNLNEYPTQIELLEPTSPDTPIGKFLEKRGIGIQQLCFRVADLLGLIEYLMENEIQMIDEKPRNGAGGKKIAFVHPKSTGGVLVELTQA
ncbi:MAG: methylmalonyl-CoA epimerase [Euryarchaeota archaeon]|nr:methylmalonyl-CoA epimerase [Euryarchaeota archaeon]|tara:strand:- start:203 stop:631 length:429 start_codon:yes stop_codon:yes gene_type:complete